MTAGRGVAALLLLTGLVYVNSLGGAFIWDDEYIYLDNPNILSETVKSAFARGSPFAYMRGSLAYDVYRPVQVLAHTWLARVFHLQPFGIHLASVAVHAATGVFVFLLVLEFAPLAVAWLAAALFLVHPIHVEAVAWMSAFSEVLAGSFMIFSLYALLRGERAVSWKAAGVEARQAPEPAGRRRWLLAASYVAAALAFLTKETTLGLPLIAAFFVGRRAWPFFAIGAGTLGMRVAAIGFTSARVPPRPPARHLYWITATALQYAKKLVWPWPVAPEYDMQHSLLAWVVFAGGCAAVAWMGYRFAKTRAALLFLLVPLAPALASSIVFATNRLAQDRYAYVAVLGVVLLIAYAAEHRAGLAACLALVVLWSALSVVAVGHWRDSETLWGYTLRVTPNSKTAVLSLGYWYAITGRPADAVRIYDYGLRIRPNDPDLLKSRKAVMSEK